LARSVKTRRLKIRGDADFQKAKAAPLGAAFAPAQGIEAEQKPAGFLLERIARFFAAEPQKMRPVYSRYAALSKPGTAGRLTGGINGRYLGETADFC
jgi:hypothetical protein